MGLAQKKVEKFTYADYLTWGDEERWEIIEGVPYAMAAPPTKHQRLLGNLFFELESNFRKKKCKVFIAPFDVRLSNFESTGDEEIETVVQPDLSVFCNPNKIDKRGANGSPDLVVEILSENNYKNDLLIKFSLYQKHKVKEYWIIDPEDNKLFIYFLDKSNRFSLMGEYSTKDIIKSTIFPKLKINLKDIFEV